MLSAMSETQPAGSGIDAAPPPRLRSDLWRFCAVTRCGTSAAHLWTLAIRRTQVAAQRLYYHDTGKQLPERVQQDLTTYKLRDDWKAALLWKALWDAGVFVNVALHPAVPPGGALLRTSGTAS